MRPLPTNTPAPTLKALVRPTLTPTPKPPRSAPSPLATPYPTAEDWRWGNMTCQGNFDGQCVDQTWNCWPPTDYGQVNCPSGQTCYSKNSTCQPPSPEPTEGLLRGNCQDEGQHRCARDGKGVEVCMRITDSSNQTALQWAFVGNCGQCRNSNPTQCLEEVVASPTPVPIIPTGTQAAAAPPESPRCFLFFCFDNPTPTPVPYAVTGAAGVLNLETTSLASVNQNSFYLATLEASYQKAGEQIIFGFNGLPEGIMVETCTPAQTVLNRQIATCTLSGQVTGDPGIYDVTVTLTDSQGEQTTFIRTIEVQGSSLFQRIISRIPFLNQLLNR